MRIASAARPPSTRAATNRSIRRRRRRAATRVMAAPRTATMSAPGAGCSAFWRIPTTAYRLVREDRADVDRGAGTGVIELEVRVGPVLEVRTGRSVQDDALVVRPVA